MERNDFCRNHIVQCPNSNCTDKFLSQQALDTHLKANNVCLFAERQMMKIESFACTGVPIPDTATTTASHVNRDNTIDLNSNTECSHVHFTEEVITNKNMDIIYSLTDTFTTKAPSLPVPKHNAQLKSSTDSHISTADRSNETEPMLCIPIQGNTSSNLLASSSARSSRVRERNRRKYFNAYTDPESDVESSDSDIDMADSTMLPDNMNNNYPDYEHDGGNISQMTIDDILNDSTDEDILLTSNDTPNMPSNNNGSHPDNEAQDTPMIDVPEAGNDNEQPSSRFIEMKEVECTEKATFTINDEDFVKGIELLNLLISKKISLHRYSDFMKWKYGQGYRFPSFHQIITLATQKMYGATLAAKMTPQISMVKLPSGRNAPLVIFNTDAMIYDLLSDLDITSRENIIFNNTSDNPFEMKEDEMFGDFDSSTYYSETMKRMNINTEEVVICPIVLYIDELKLDSFGKLGLEPVVMSLMIYNRKTRNLAKAWRVIGYLPSFGSMFGKKSYSADDKAEDYHFCLSKILHGV